MSCSGHGVGAMAGSTKEVGVRSMLAAAACWFAVTVSFLDVTPAMAESVLALPRSTDSTGLATLVRADALGRAGPSFSLVDQHGRRVSEASLAEKPVVLHFGFTSCPAICPTTLFEVAARMRELGPAADEVHFVFVTVDPERDTPAVLKDYVASFDERIIALTGDVGETEALAKGVGASFAKVATPDGGYTLDHSVNAFLLTRGWQVGRQMYFGVDSRPEYILATLHAMIGQKLISEKLIDKRPGDLPPSTRGTAQ